MGITEASYTMIISKFNTTAFMKKDNQWTELIEYLENLHALDATDKKSEAQKKVMISQKIRLNPILKIIGLAVKGKSQPKRGKCPPTQKPPATAGVIWVFKDMMTYLTYYCYMMI